MKVLSLGAGAMATALLVPMYGEAEQLEFSAYSPGKKSANALALKLEGASVNDLQEFSALGEQDYYFICCKPQQFDDLAGKLAGSLNPDGVVVSILAGTDLNTIKKKLKHQKVVRLMPNTPTTVGAGIVLFLADSSVEQEKQKELLEDLKRVAKVFCLSDEDKFDRVMGYTSSGPAYIFELVRIMAHELKSIGISREDAQELMIELFWGSAKMMKKSNASPEELRISVTSPGGVTEKALEVLRNRDLR